MGFPAMDGKKKECWVGKAHPTPPFFFLTPVNPIELLRAFINPSPNVVNLNSSGGTPWLKIM